MIALLVQAAMLPYNIKHNPKPAGLGEQLDSFCLQFARKKTSKYKKCIETQVGLIDPAVKHVDPGKLLPRPIYAVQRSGESVQVVSRMVFEDQCAEMNGRLQMTACILPPAPEKK